MRDNYENGFSPEFTQKAWENMRGILDEEMPEKRRRRPVFWWFFGLLLPLLLAGGAYGVVMLNDNGSGVDSIPEIPNPQNQILNSQERLVPKAPSPQKPIAENNAQIPTENPGSTASDPSTQLTSDYPVETIESSELSILITEENTSSNQSSSIKEKEEFTSIYVLEPLPNDMIQALAEEEAKITIPTSLTEAPKSRKIKLGLRGAWHNPMFLRPGGVSLAFEAAMPLGKSKWSLDAGLGYYTTNWNKTAMNIGRFLSADENGSLDDDEGPGAGGFDPVENVSLENYTDLDLVANKSTNIGGTLYYPARLHYLILPVGLSYQVSPRLSFRTGLEGRYLLAANDLRNDQDFISITNRLSGAIEFASNDAISRDLENVLNIRRFSLAAFAGMDIRLSKTLNLGFAYHQGLTDMLPVQDGHQNFGSLNVSLGLRF